MSGNFNEDIAALVVTIAWSMWYNRNEVRLMRGEWEFLRSALYVILSLRPLSML